MGAFRSEALRSMKENALENGRNGEKEMRNRPESGSAREHNRHPLLVKTELWSSHV